jgi:hypothetical protein
MPINAEPPAKRADNAIAPANQVMTSHGITWFLHGEAAAEGSDSNGVGLLFGPAVAGASRAPTLDVVRAAPFDGLATANVAMGVATIAVSVAQARRYRTCAFRQSIKRFLTIA